MHCGPSFNIFVHHLHEPCQSKIWIIHDNNYPRHGWSYAICWCQTQEKDYHYTPSSTAIWWWDKTQKTPLLHAHCTWAASQVKENDEVPCHLTGRGKAPTSFKPEKPSRINDLVITCPMPLIPFLHKSTLQYCVLESPTKIISQIHSIGHASKIMKFSTLSPIISRTEANLLHWFYQQEYSDVRISMAPWCQYKSVDVPSRLYPIIVLSQWLNNSHPLQRLILLKYMPLISTLNWIPLTVTKRKKLSTVYS